MSKRHFQVCPAQAETGAAIEADRRRRLSALDRQCECVNTNHAGGRCSNIAHAHHYCGPCQSEGAVRMTPELSADRALELVAYCEQWHSIVTLREIKLYLGAFAAKQETIRQHEQTIDTWKRDFDYFRYKAAKLLTMTSSEGEYRQGFVDALQFVVSYGDSVKDSDEAIIIVENIDTWDIALTEDSNG